MHTYFQICYVDAEKQSVHSDGCMKTLDKEFLHKLLDEFLDNHRRDGNTNDEDDTQFLLKICSSHE